MSNTAVAVPAGLGAVPAGLGAVPAGLCCPWVSRTVFAVPGCPELSLTSPGRLDLSLTSPGRLDLSFLDVSGPQEQSFLDVSGPQEQSFLGSTGPGWEVRHVLRFSHFLRYSDTVLTVLTHSGPVAGDLEES